MDDARWVEAEARARETLARDAAWPELWEAIAPAIERWMAAPAFAGRLALDEDHRREVVVLAWEKLQERGFAKLRAFYEKDGEEPARRFRAWLRRVVKNIAIDHQRSLPTFVRKRTATTPSAPAHDYWISIVSITSNAALFSNPAEGRAEAQRMLAFLDEEVSPRRRRAAELLAAGAAPAEIAAAVGVRDAREAARLAQRAAERLKFRRALELWSQGFGDDDIARELGLEDGGAAERMIKAAKELLRRAFR